MYATVADAEKAYAGENAEEVQLRVVMTSAAGIVSGFSKPPEDSDEQEDFESKAADAELFLGGYLWNTGGYVKRESVLDATTEYGTFTDVMNTARATLSPYVRDLEAEAQERRGHSQTLEVTSTFPAVSEDDDILWRW